MGRLADHTIIMAGAIPWTGARHRQHEVATLLSDRCPVFYLEPATKQPSGLSADAPVAAQPPTAGLLASEAIKPGLTVVHTDSCLTPHQTLSATFNCHRRRVLARRLLAQFPELRRTAPILWLDESAAEPYIGRFGECLVVYDCVDEDWAFSLNPVRRRVLRRYEDVLTRRADLIFTSSQPLLERKRAVNPRTTLALNGVDYDHFAQAAAPFGQPVGSPVTIGYVGSALPDRVDYTLLAHIATRHPEWQLEMVGYSPWPKKVPQPPNVVRLGTQPYADLPGYVTRYDVVLMPYRVVPEVAYAHPKKMFEYLAAGKPIVSVPLPSVLPYEGPVKIGHTHDEFVAQIEACLVEQQQPDLALRLQHERQAVARQHTWQGLIDHMVETVEAALA